MPTGCVFTAKLSTQCNIPASVLDLARTAAANWNGKKLTEVRNPLFPVQSLRPHSYDRKEIAPVPRLTGNRGNMSFDTGLFCSLTDIRTIIGQGPTGESQQHSGLQQQDGGRCARASPRSRLAGSRTPQMSDVRSADVAHSD
jgi:hypothetical protein